MSIDIETLEPGDRVAVKAAEYAFGLSFLAGTGTVLQNLDGMSRERGEILIRFDRGVTGIFKAAVLKDLLLDGDSEATD